MTEANKCPHCGAKMVEYAHTLSKGLLRSFARMVMLHAPKRVFSFSECETLTYSQAANLQKLRYWGLIKRMHDEAGKGGDWAITDLGMDFICGGIALQTKVWTYRGVVQRFDGESKTVGEITGGWKYRYDYAREAVAR